MLVPIIYGEKYKEGNAFLHKVADAFFEANINAAHREIDEQNFSSGALAECIAQAGLFTPKTLIEIHHTLGGKENAEIFLSMVKGMAGSDNMFIVIERETNAPLRTALEKYAGGEKFLVPVGDKDKKPLFNIFTLTEALGNRDKKLAWILLQKALQLGMEPEEINSMVGWQIKQMLLVKNALEARPPQTQNLGMKPFVLQKTLKYAQKYSHDELVRLSSQLLDIYHGVRRGEFELGVSLEKFILSL